MTNIPINKALYARVKREAKQKFKVWPSAYASAWLVKTYKKRGGKYRVSSTKREKSRRKSRKRSRRKSRKRSRRKSRKRKSYMRFSRRKSRKRRLGKKTGLSRWFAEEWIDVCKLPKIVPCGRKSARKSPRSYPYCRPRYKITSKSPKTARSYSRAEIRRRCKKKKRNPSRRIK